MLSVLPSLLALGTAALAALVLTLNLHSSPEKGAARDAAARALSLAVTVQCFHFTEEALTGFHERFGALFGLPGMPLSLFLAFNLVWIGIWFASVPALRSDHRGAFFAAWFLAIAGMLNGIAHPLMALASRGYFPGLVTSPIIAGVSFRLWHRLRKATVGQQLPTT